MPTYGVPTQKKYHSHKLGNRPEMQVILPLGLTHPAQPLRPFKQFCRIIKVERPSRRNFNRIKAGHCTASPFQLNMIQVIRDTCPCVVKKKPYGSPNGLLCMAQGQRSGIDSVI